MNWKMKFHAVYCLVMVTYTQLGAITLPKRGCDCSCDCQDPEMPCVTPSPSTTPAPTTSPPETECVPVSKCDNFVDTNSDFMQNCAPQMPPEDVGTWYINCLIQERAGPDALQIYCDQLLTLCRVKYTEVELPQVDCSTTMTPPDETTLHTTQAPDPSFELDCECSCTCDEVPFNTVTCDTTTTNMTEETSATMTTTTTECITGDPCDILINPEGEIAECLDLIAAGIKEQMIEDCQRLKNDTDRLQQLFDNIAAICELKTDMSLELAPPICISTTLPTTPTATSGTTTTAIPTTMPPTAMTISPLVPPGVCRPSLLTIPSGYADDTFLNVCIDLVFMVDASNNVGRDTFNKFIGFVKEVIDHLVITSNCTHAGMLSFSKTTHVEVDLKHFTSKEELLKAADMLPFLGSVTNVHRAIDKFDALLDDDPIHQECSKVGVLISGGDSTHWRATVNSMVQLYTKYPQAKMVVVTFEHSGKEAGLDQVYAIATGVEDDNVKKLHVDDIGIDPALHVAQMIEKPRDKSVCTQWATHDNTQTGTDEDRNRGAAMFGVYEKDSSIGQCHGTDIFINTKYALPETYDTRNPLSAKFVWYLSQLKFLFPPFLVDRRWYITEKPNTHCRGVQYKIGGVLMNPKMARPDCYPYPPSFCPWFEMISSGISVADMKVECYN